MVAKKKKQQQLNQSESVWKRFIKKKTITILVQETLTKIISRPEERKISRKSGPYEIDLRAPCCCCHIFFWNRKKILSVEGAAIFSFYTTSDWTKWVSARWCHQYLLPFAIHVRERIYILNKCTVCWLSDKSYFVNF